MTFPSPALSAPALANYQLQYNGLAMGPGTPYRITNIAGLDLPNMRGGDVAYPRDHGEQIGLDLMAGRDVTIDLQVVSDGTSLQHALAAFATAFGPAGTTEAPLYVQLPNLPLLAMMCRPRQRSVPITLEGYTVAGVASVAVQVHATDPRLYSAPSTSTTVGAPVPLGGLTFPVTFPATFGGGSATADIFATNAGNVEMRPILVITGPCTDPKIVNDQTGWSLQFANPAETGFTLSTGDTLTVDLMSHSVLYLVNGTTIPTAVRSWVVPGSVWPNATSIAGLEPGSNTIQFSTADAGGVAGTLTLEYASAYLI
jgi:hypothetical protein